MTRADAPPWLGELFASLDAKDTARWLGYLSEDASFRYASHPAVRGHADIGEFVAGFLGSLDGIRHRVDAVWADSGAVICEGEVSYLLPGVPQPVTLPFVNVLRLSNGRISDYRVYIDPAPLSSPA